LFKPNSETVLLWFVLQQVVEQVIQQIHNILTLSCSRLAIDSRDYNYVINVTS